jgi:hypothetical protein
LEIDGKMAVITPAPVETTVSLQEIQSLLKYKGSTVPVNAMRVTDTKADSCVQ